MKYGRHGKSGDEWRLASQRNVGNILVLSSSLSLRFTHRSFYSKLYRTCSHHRHRHLLSKNIAFQFPPKFSIWPRNGTVQKQTIISLHKKPHNKNTMCVHECKVLKRSTCSYSSRIVQSALTFLEISQHLELSKTTRPRYSSAWN